MLEPVLPTAFLPAGLKVAEQDKDFWQRSTHQTVYVIETCVCSCFDTSYCMTIYILCSDCIGMVFAPHIVYALNYFSLFVFPVTFDAQMGQRENIDPLSVNRSFNLSRFDWFLSKR